MKMQSKSYGYYYVSLSLTSGKKLLRTNNDRAFIVSQLQDLLSPRLLINSVPFYQQLASCIDLLAFSLTPEAIQIVVFTIDSSMITYLVNHLSERLIQYQCEYHPTHYELLPESRLKKLRGPHQALAKSVELHICHEDWEYDRYSSIGFYLHDRRGDWMRLWRLTSLYDNDNRNYRLLIEERLRKHNYTIQPTIQSYAS